MRFIMAKYVYPAIFEENEQGGYCVSFPDIQGGYTEGKDLANAMEMAQDALCLVLYNNEIHGIEIPPPTQPEQLNPPVNGIVSYVLCDTNYYKRYFANKLINKTVTIPAQLNQRAEKEGINFSQVLRTGLEQILNQGV